MATRNSPGPEALLLEIAHCPIAAKGAAGELEPDHPCHRVVSFQERLGLLSPERFHLPEPWQGQLSSAPLLFLSSNPSISASEHFPTAAWRDEDVVHFFGPGFAERARSVGRSRYWSGIHRRAIELLGGRPRPGVDYALTEVVRCKSRSEVGVAQAVRFCADQWLDRTLSASSARVILVVGAKAHAATARALDLDERPSLGTVLDHELPGGRHLLLAFGAHPSSFGPQTIAKTFTADNLSRLVAALA